MQKATATTTATISFVGDGLAERQVQPADLRITRFNEAGRVVGVESPAAVEYGPSGTGFCATAHDGTRFFVVRADVGPARQAG